MRRLLLASFGLASFLALIHCSSATTREGFDEDGGTSAPKTTESSASSSGGSLSSDASTPDADDAPCTQDIDVVLVLDVSSSMGFVLDDLGSGISGIVDAANGLKAGAHFGMVGYVDNAAFGLGGSDANGVVHTQASTLKSAFSLMKSTYTTPNRNPGDGPDGPTLQNPLCEENALDGLYMAAAQFPWRDGAARIVVIATDDTFLVDPDNYGDRDGDGKEDKTDYPREGNYPAVHGYADTIAALKAAKARVFSVTRLSEGGGGIFGGGSSCGTGRRHTQTDAITYGWSHAYDNGEAPVPDQTGGANFDLDAVKSGSLNLADTINQVVLQTHCGGDPPK